MKGGYLNVSGYAENKGLHLSEKCKKAIKELDMEHNKKLDAYLSELSKEYDEKFTEILLDEILRHDNQSALTLLRLRLKVGVEHCLQ